MNPDESPPLSLTEKDWERLLMRIRTGSCTPFLGAGACYGTLPLGATIAKAWADQHQYPLQDNENLVRVAQFLAIENDPMYPKETLLNTWIRTSKLPDFNTTGEPHGLLARLPLPIYITTNYDPFMTEALRHAGKTPRREVCRWNARVQKKLRDQPSALLDRSYEPSAAEPVVFHLHGYDPLPESLVLTEDDYLDFLLRFSSEKDLIPLRIQEAFADTSLLFIGYSLSDINFRVLFRSIVTSVERSSGRGSFTVLFPRPEQEHAQQYLESYFSQMDMKVVWGSAAEFVAELDRRWKAFTSEQQPAQP